MKAHTDYLVFEIKKRTDFINITDDVLAIIVQSNIVDGLVLINPMHITAAVYVNDAENN